MSFSGIDRSIRGSIVRLVAVLGLILLVVGCDISNSTVTIDDGAANMAVEPPTPIFASRMVNRDNLVLRVIVGSSDPIDTGRDPQTGRFQVTTQIPVGQETTIRIEWYESGIAGIDAPGLLLATASESIVVVPNSPGEVVRFTDDQYDTSSPDLDNDGRSNLDERNANTNPVDASDPPDAVVTVPLNVRFELPQVFAESEEAIVQQIVAIGQVNSQPIELSFEDDVWAGAAEVTENTDALISVEFRLGSASDALRLAARTATENAGGGTTVTFDADTYDLDFNADGDDFSNAVEIRDGTNPNDSSDPQTDPCSTGQFSEGCTTDTDNDGTPDSVEGPSADEDDDGRPDYLESNVVDADNDGTFAQADPREDDPCIPFENNQPCIDQQTPPDPCEGAQGDFTAGCDTDSDNDGEPDSVEGPTANSDGDTILDFLDPDNVDSDGDGTFDELDDDNDDPCVPTMDNVPCQDLQPPDDEPADPCDGAQGNFSTGCQFDTDGDEKPDSVETREADTDDDNRSDFRESATEDSDGDDVVDEQDPFNADPCRPNNPSPTCPEDDDDDDEDDDDDDEDPAILPPSPP